ncbi:MAG: TIGR01459 family HAD-type hydrolase [Pseudomonadota bacterium]
MVIEEPASLLAVARRYDAVVLDQWGVLHDGTAPYPGAVEALEALARAGVRLAVLSNSGKRAAPNAERIARIGFPSELFETVMTSGEALWQDLATGRVAASVLYPIERARGDAEDWVSGSGARLVSELAEADAILLMGVPDDARPAEFEEVMAEAFKCELTVLCTNPDRASPRAGGRLVMSPGQLAHDQRARGGKVAFYGKPYGQVFDAVARALGTENGKLLMVGDSLEHDIAGANGAGWDSLFVRGGLHAEAFTGSDAPLARLERLIVEETAPRPTYTLHSLGQLSELHDETAQ